jgi:glycosyltransferase involved in cell wall biosynthesis
VYDFLNKTEKVNSKKLIKINYGYNFRQYEPANEEKVSEIRNKFNCTLLVVSIARLTAPKRHILMFEAIKNCIDFGLDIKFVCLGSGPLNVELVKWINENNLDKNIFLEGVQLKIFDYLKAADILLHLSATEASNSVVKEAALALKPVIVCAGVGDFSDYVTDKENSFLVNKNNPVAETVEILKTYYNKAGALQKIGEKFNQTVLTQFDIKNVESSYNQLLKQH